MSEHVKNADFNRFNAKIPHVDPPHACFYGDKKERHMSKLNLTGLTPVHYGLRAHHLKTRKITAALWTYNMGKNWYSCLLEARKYMVLPPP